MARKKNKVTRRCRHCKRPTNFLIKTKDEIIKPDLCAKCYREHIRILVFKTLNKPKVKKAIMYIFLKQTQGKGIKK